MQQHIKAAMHSPRAAMSVWRLFCAGGRSTGLEPYTEHRAHDPHTLSFSQFIVVSLKEGMFSNANVIFRTKFIDGVSTVTRSTNDRKCAQKSMCASCAGTCHCHLSQQ